MCMYRRMTGENRRERRAPCFLFLYLSLIYLIFLEVEQISLLTLLWYGKVKGKEEKKKNKVHANKSSRKRERAHSTADQVCEEERNRRRNKSRKRITPRLSFTLSVCSEKNWRKKKRNCELKGGKKKERRRTRGAILGRRKLKKRTDRVASMKPIKYFSRCLYTRNLRVSSIFIRTWEQEVTFLESSSLSLISRCCFIHREDKKKEEE